MTLDLLPLQRMEQILQKALARAALSDAQVCWEFHGTADSHGYPMSDRIVGGRTRHLRFNRLIVAVSEGISYADVNQACHSCDNPPCINPVHIWHGDNSANQRDMVAKGRQGRFAQHGTLSKYVGSRCRCDECTAAHREHYRVRNGYQRILGPRRSPEVRENVRLLYRQSGLTQRELAEQLEIPYQTVARWVRGLHPPARDTAGRWSRQLWTWLHARCQVEF